MEVMFGGLRSGGEGLGFLISEFGSQVSGHGFEFRVSGSGYWVSGLRFGFRDDDFLKELLAVLHGAGCRVQGSWFRV